MKALIDTNIIVDVLQNRQPWASDGQEIFIAAANRKFEGFITAKEVTDIHYFIRKNFRGHYNADRQARQVISKLFSLFGILDTSATDYKKAVLSECPDYEDAVMIETAIRTGMDCIITRNTADYSRSPVKIFSPSEFLLCLQDTH